MRTCPSCGRENPDDLDFCECGAYLRWEPTNYQMPAVAPPAAAAPPPAAAAPPPAAPAPPDVAPAGPDAAAPPAVTPPAPDAGSGSPPPPAREQFISGIRPAVPQPKSRRAAPRHQEPALPLGPNQTLPKQQAVPAQAPAPRAVPQGKPPAATISLRLPGEDPSASAGPVAVAVLPSDRVRVIADIRNQGGVVDNYSLVIHGFPAEWVTVIPETIFLVPLGNKGSYQQEVELHLHPPRDPAAESRRWELVVAVYSHTAQAEIAREPMTLGILPYEDCTIRVRPERASGRRRARYDVTVVNNANAKTALALAGQDNEGACSFEFDRDTVELRPGESKLIPMRCRPPRQIWLGRGRDRSIEIHAAGGEAGEEMLAAKQEAKLAGAGRKKFKAPGMPGGLPGVSGPKMHMPQIGLGPGGKPQIGMPNMRGPQFRGLNVRNPASGLQALKGLQGLKRPGQAAEEAPAAPLLPTQAIFRQKAWLPWWLAIVAPLLLLLIILLVLLWPRTVNVPKLVGSKDVSTAQEKLPDKLKIGATREVVSAKPAGAVIGQKPKAGASVEEDTAVDVVVAVSSTETVVPKLVGLTISQAEGALHTAGLTVGAVGPVSPPDPKAKIIGQLPSAKAAAKTGSPVAITYPDPQAAGKDSKDPKDPSKPGDAGGKDGDGATGDGGGDIAIPEPKGAQEKSYSDALVKLGLKPVGGVRELNAAQAGTVLGTTPEAGSKVGGGTEVKLRVSAGFPLTAYDTAGNIKLYNGKPLDALAETFKNEKDPTFAPNGHTVVYVEDGQLVTADAVDRQADRDKLTAGSTNYAHPTFAPTRADTVLAVLRFTGSDSDLCFARVTKGRRVTPQCIADDKMAVRSVHWLDGGNFILLAATRLSDKSVGMYQYKSDKPFSANASNWHDGQWITDLGKRGVYDAVLSPDGKLLAGAANINGKGYRLYLTDKFDNIQFTGIQPLPVLACKLAWIDNENLAIVQFNADCDQGGSGIGQIVRVGVPDPTKPRAITGPIGITDQGDNPAFPLLLGG